MNSVKQCLECSHSFIELDICFVCKSDKVFPKYLMPNPMYKKLNKKIKVTRKKYAN